MTEPHRSARIAAVTAVAGVAIVISGAVMVLLQPATSFGWFADAPPTAGSVAPVSILLGPFGIAGAAAIGVGIGLAAFAGGWMLARRRPPRGPGRPTAD